MLIVGEELQGLSYEAEGLPHPPMCYILKQQDGKTIENQKEEKNHLVLKTLFSLTEIFEKM